MSEHIDRHRKIRYALIGAAVAFPLALVFTIFTLPTEALAIPMTETPSGTERVAYYPLSRFHFLAAVLVPLIFGWLAYNSEQVFADDDGMVELDADDLEENATDGGAADDV